MKRKWWPIRVRYYPDPFEGWKRVRYTYYVYEDGAYEHELRIGKFWVYFGHPARGV